MSQALFYSLHINRWLLSLMGEYLIFPIISEFKVIGDIV